MKKIIVMAALLIPCFSYAGLHVQENSSATLAGITLGAPGIRFSDGSIQTIAGGGGGSGDIDGVTAGNGLAGGGTSGTVSLAVNFSSVTAAGPAIDLNSTETSGTLPVAKGGTNLTAAADDNTVVGNGTTWETKAIPSCSDGTNSKLLYNTSTNAFSCGTDQNSGGGGGPSGLINTSSQFNVPYYSASGSSNTLSGNSNFTFNGSTLTVTGVIIASSGIIVGNGSDVSVATFREGAAPSNPDANNHSLYFDSANSNRLTSKNSAGTTSVYSTGSGADASGYGHCFVSYGCAPIAPTGRAATIAAMTNKAVSMSQIVIPYKIKLARYVSYAVSGVSTNAVTMGIYNDNNGVPGSVVTGSTFTKVNLNSAYITGVWGSGNVTLDPGVYWFAFAQEGTSAQYHYDTGPYGTAHEYLGYANTPKTVTCANSATGAGATLELPSSCGSASQLNTFGTFMPIVLATSN